MTYTISQIESLTGIKPHILRYWEEVIPGFTPQKDLNGRRLYTQQELNLINRIKFLIYEKKYTAEGAGRQILEESQQVQDNAELIHQIRNLKSELSDLFLKIHNN